MLFKFSFHPFLSYKHRPAGSFSHIHSNTASVNCYQVAGTGTGPGLRKRLNNRITSAPDPGPELLLHTQASWEIRERSV